LGRNLRFGRLRRSGFHRLGLLNVLDQARAHVRGGFFGKVLEANTVGYFMRNGVRRHTHVYALAPRIFHNFLVIELQLFRKIVNSYLLLTCRHN
jgi:hypothetical protein